MKQAGRSPVGLEDQQKPKQQGVQVAVLPLSPALRRAQKAAADGKPVSSAAVTACKLGTELIREWNGKVFKVEVKDGGYSLDGAHFKSLSAIALHIAGTSWSGPRFFSLTCKTGASQ